MQTVTKLFLTLIILLLPLNSKADQYSTATNKLLEAWYEQSDYKKEIDKELKELENTMKAIDSKYVPDYLKTPAGITYFLGKIIQEQKLVVVWRF